MGSFEALLTPEGITVAAALLVTFVEIVKTALPPVDQHISGATLAFLFSGLLYGSAALVLPDAGPDLYLSIFTAWIATAAAAMGIRAGASHIAEVRAGTAGGGDQGA
jgi:hypothetical protein